MNNFITAIKRFDFTNLGKSKKIKQVASLYTSTCIGIVIGIGVSIVNTRLLGPQQYGDLKFLQNLFAFTVTFLTLGVFVSGSRLLAQNEHENVRRQLVGNLFIFASVISVVFTIGLFIFSFFEDNIFHNGLGRIIRIFSPLAFVFPFNLCFEKIMLGSNRIYELSVFQTGPKILYLVSAILFNYFVPLSLTSALTLHLLAFMLLIGIMAIRFKPRFDNLKQNIFLIWTENKTNGLQVYIGLITGVASGHLGAIFIGYFMNNTNVGFFSLALATTAPLTMIPSAMGTAFFKDFANRQYIPRKTITITILLSICALVFFFVLIEKVILLLYSSEYAAVVPIAYLVSIGSIVHGFGDFFTRFLGAHGRGREMRNSAVAVGISNVLGYYFLVKYFGVMGAASTMVISSCIYLLTRYYIYNRMVHKYRNKSQISF